MKTLETASWRRAKELLASVLEIEKEARPAYLEACCASDPELKAEIEAYLQDEDDVREFIETPITSRLSAGKPECREGTRIGAYLIVRLVSRGGMGIVYRAKRADGIFEQDVAIKVLKWGFDTEEIVRRFKLERRILSALVHSNIARILDGGTTDDGLPYFVMEYVDGVHIDKYCAERGLSIESRLELFRSVCQAVHLAHRNLVIHRDLKPANILVTPAGTPKLLDFGIAKLLTPEGLSQATQSVLGRPMTPAYASPEQLRGEPLATSSDVYSLGIILFQLLTAHHPFTDCESDLEARELEPAWPSAVVASSRRAEETPTPSSGHGKANWLQRRLAGDLDAIVTKALHYKPEDRYGSVEELAEDLGRHMAGRPVLAHRGSWHYRAVKWARRNRWRVGTALVLSSLIGSLGVNVIQRQRVEYERQRVEREIERAEEIGEFVRDLLASSDPSGAEGQTIQLRKVLDKGAQLISETLVDQPELQAALMSTMGQAYRHQGAYDKAEFLLRQSLRIRLRLLGEDHRLVARSRNNLAQVLRDRGVYEEAEGLLRKALRTIRRQSGEHMEVAIYLNNLAGLERLNGDFDEAVELYRQALEIKRRELGDVDDESIARSLNSLALGLEALGELDQAEARYREALAMRERIYGPGHAAVATSLSSLGAFLCDQGRTAAGERSMRRSLEIRRKVPNLDPGRIALILRRLAVCIQMRGDLAAAEEHYREALKIELDHYGEEHLEVATTLRELATLEAAKGNATAAIETARRSLEIFRGRFYDTHWQIVDAQSVLGGCLLDDGNLAEAESSLRSSYEILRTAKGDSARETREARARLEKLDAATKP